MRIRSLKPGFFINERLAECSPWARLLYAGLWCLADREGRLEDRPVKIRGEIFPYENHDVNSLLDELASRGFIVRYVTEEGQQLIAIPTFLQHQNPHAKETASRFYPPKSLGPVITGPSLEITGPDRVKHCTCPADLGSRSGIQERPPLSPPAGGVEAFLPTSTPAKAKEGNAPTAAEVMQVWNLQATASGWTRCDTMGVQRVKALGTRLRDAYWLASWRAALARAAELKWLRGENSRRWIANIDWFLRPKTVCRIVEGYYDDRQAGSNGVNSRRTRRREVRDLQL